MTAERHPRAGGRRARLLVWRVANPVVMRLGLAGGRRSPWGVLSGPGRTSGVLRRNPVVPHLVGDIVLIPLSFGLAVQGLRNVTAAGGGTLRYRGLDWRLAEPRLVPFDALLELRVEAGW